MHKNILMFIQFSFTFFFFCICLQALAVIPRNPTQFHVPKKLGFSSTINRSSYLSNSASSSRFSVSRVSSTSLSSNHEAFFKEFARQSFVTRAESESGGGEVVAETENVEEEVVVEGSEEEEVQAEVEGAVKEPRKPRVKLGDIIGVLTLICSGFASTVIMLRTIAFCF